MKSLRGRLAALEAAAKRASGDRQLDLWAAAMAGDPGATAEFEELRDAVPGHLHELLDAIRQPLEASGQWPYRVTEIDEERPSV